MTHVESGQRLVDVPQFAQQIVEVVIALRDHSVIGNRRDEFGRRRDRPTQLVARWSSTREAK